MFSQSATAPWRRLIRSGWWYGCGSFAPPESHKTSTGCPDLWPDTLLPSHTSLHRLSKVSEGLLRRGATLSHLDPMQASLGFGLLSFGQFVERVGCLMHPATLLAVLQKACGNAFQKPKAPSPIANLGSMVSPRCFSSTKGSFQAEADSR